MKPTPEEKMIGLDGDQIAWSHELEKKRRKELNSFINDPKNQKELSNG